MNKSLYSALAAAGLALAVGGCADQLLVDNPNAPTPEVLTTDEGLRRAATGVYAPLDGNWNWFGLQYHEGMGDAIPSAVGNWGFVDVVNPQLITYSDGSTNLPQTIRGFGEQANVLSRMNTRLNVDNPVAFEWTAMYKINNAANLVLQGLASTSLSLNGTAAEQTAKKRGYTAWAHFWKGLAYSHIGLLYEKGVIEDKPNTTNPNFKTSAEMLAESNRQLDLAIANADGIPSVVAALTPALFTSSPPTAATFAQAAQTLKARNLLSGKYRSEMTNADWRAVKAAADAGLTSNTGTITLRNDQTTWASTGSLLYRAGGLGPTWAYVSQRLIQEFQPGDQRLAVATAATAKTVVRVANPADALTSAQLGATGNNRFDRGANSLSNGRGERAVFEFPDNFGTVNFYLVSAEEALLASAEANLALGDAPAAATKLNAVRTMQGAGIAATAADMTPELLRRERRIALLGRGLAYYDARRFKITLPAAQGGGRTGAHVWQRLSDGTFRLDRNATIIYNFVPYWPLPAGESELNKASGTPTPS